MDYKAFLLKYGLDAAISLYKKLASYFKDKKESEDKLKALEEAIKEEKPEAELREDIKDFLK